MKDDGGMRNEEGGRGRRKEGEERRCDDGGLRKEDGGRRNEKAGIRKRRNLTRGKVTVEVKL